MKKLLTILFVLVLAYAGAPSAAATDVPSQTTRAVTEPVPVLNMGESAGFSVTDTGRSLIIEARGRGFTDDNYVSLIYADAACSVPVDPSEYTLAGAFEATGDGRQNLYARYTGAAYEAVVGGIGSISVRAVILAVNAGDGNFLLTAEARACATLELARLDTREA